MSVYHLIYQSQAKRPFNTGQLEALLRQARSQNHAERVTGLLLYTFDGRFFQVLEGEEAAVRRLYYDKIAHDPRHDRCAVLGEGPATARSFPDWSMGFRRAEKADVEQLVGYFDLSNARFLLPRAHAIPGDVMLKLLRFLAAGADDPQGEGAPQ